MSVSPRGRSSTTINLVVDANILISALVADSKTRELIVTLEPTLVTPETIHGEIEKYDDLIMEKSGMNRIRVRQFIELLFSQIETVSGLCTRP